MSRLCPVGCASCQEARDRQDSQQEKRKANYASHFSTPSTTTRYRQSSPSRFACNVSVTMRLEYWLRESCCLLCRTFREPSLVFPRTSSHRPDHRGMVPLL